ncbi:hypothetical protein [Noviherbaspirillum saxi]|uniref:Uncharacterized protein n=1 Tax=Noviherbaspirillum saxi TaxID=2320863 RepID=A0A3A3FQN4_9BURK|nr:hypothetical protein [Noviherbaspirillum saxi]RJF96029.1 hypothetical protein D3871_22050 [Noviherbaspirillum saxi]
MQEANAQMALRLHQITGEPLAHCSYLLNQTKGDYETALKILERILQQRQQESTGQTAETPDAGLTDAPSAASVVDLEHRVQRLETQLALLAETLDTVSGKLTLLLEKLSSDPQ